MDELTSLEVVEDTETEGGLPKELASALKEIIKLLTEPEKESQDSIASACRGAEYYWRGIQDIFYNAEAKDWRRVSDETIEGEEIDENADYNRIVNIYKAHGESIIAALSSGVPYTRFFPDDAENVDDIATSKAYSKIAELIGRHNKAQILFIRLLFILWNQHFVAIYNTHQESFEFGSYRVPVYKKRTVNEVIPVCAECGTEVTSSFMEVTEGPMGPEEVELTDCQGCGMASEITLDDRTLEEPYIDSYEDRPKSREILEAYGPINVLIPTHVTEQKFTPYLGLEQEQHVALVKEIYPDIADEIDGTTNLESQRRLARTSILSYSEDNKNLVTTSRYWVRPWAFNIYAGKDEDKKALVQKLREMFPNGVLAEIVSAGKDPSNGILARATPKNLDDEWTVYFSPTSTHVHGDPLGKTLLPMQDLKNEQYSLTVESIQYGIGETFVDPDVLDFQAYKERRALPGAMTPAKPGSAQAILAEAFHTIKPATLSREVDSFHERVDRDSQFVSGSLPSIYGGTNPGGSKTLGEYTESRNQALQRLSTVWKGINVLWAETMRKAANSFAAHMKQDQKFVEKQGSSFINVWIRKADLQGKIGEVEPENSEQFPVSWGQIKDTILQFLTLNNQMLNGLIFHPSNVALVSKILGIHELNIPGEDDKNKELEIISELLKTTPIMGPMGEMLPSIPVEVGVDDNNLGYLICRTWLNSEVGYDARSNNNMGYQNVVARMMQHKAILDQQMFQEMQRRAMMGEGNEGNKGKPPENQNLSDNSGGQP